MKIKTLMELPEMLAAMQARIEFEVTRLKAKNLKAKNLKALKKLSKE